MHKLRKNQPWASMFHTINIRDFRSCSDATIADIGSILVLIGRNGAGKTNILKAIEWASYMATHSAEKRSRPLSQIQNLFGHVQFTFTMNEKIYCYEIRKQIVESAQSKDESKRSPTVVFEENIHVLLSDWVHLISRSGEDVTLLGTDDVPTKHWKISDSTPALLALQIILPENDGFRTLAYELGKFLSSVRYYPLIGDEKDNESIVIMGSAYSKWAAEKNSNNTTENLLCKLIYLSKEHPDRFEELQSLIGADGLSLITKISIWSQKLGPDDDSEEFYVVLFSTSKDSDSQRQFSYTSLSFGTKRILSLLIAIMYDRSSVYLIEQPEDGIHHGLVEKITPLFRAYSKNSQFIIASHSISVLNNTDPKEVRLVSMVDQVTSIRALNSTELEAACSYLEEDGPFSEFLQSIEEN